MADTAHPAAHFPLHPLAALKSALYQLGEFFVVYPERRMRLKEIDALRGKTDAELAAIGLTRDEIVSRVLSASYNL